jgi:hypothetical protein
MKYTLICTSDPVLDIIHEEVFGTTDNPELAVQWLENLITFMACPIPIEDIFKKPRERNYIDIRYYTEEEVTAMIRSFEFAFPRHCGYVYCKVEE